MNFCLGRCFLEKSIEIFGNKLLIFRKSVLCSCITALKVVNYKNKNYQEKILFKKVFIFPLFVYFPFEVCYFFLSSIYFRPFTCYKEMFMKQVIILKSGCAPLLFPSKKEKCKKI